MYATDLIAQMPALREVCDSFVNLKAQQQVPQYKFHVWWWTVHYLKLM